MTLQMQYSRQKEFSFYQKNVNVAWIQHEHGSRSKSEWVFYSVERVKLFWILLHLLSFIAFMIALKASCALVKRSCKEFFVMFFLKLLCMLKQNAIWWMNRYSIHNASFRVESFAKRWIFQPLKQKTMNDVHNKHSFSHRSLLQSVFLS